MSTYCSYVVSALSSTKWTSWAQMKTAISYLVPLQSYMYASCKTLLKIYFAIEHVDWKIKHSYSYSYSYVLAQSVTIC